MSVVSVVIVVVVAIFAASVLGAWLRGGSPRSDTKEVREEMQRLLTAQAQGFSAQMGQVTQLVTQQLSEVRRELEQGVASSGRITADAQREMTEQLRSSTTVLSQLTQHLGQVQQSGRELTQAAQTMQTVLGGPKSRGVLGEAQLESLLADILPRAAYDVPYRFCSGATAAAALHTGKKLIAIDADFPMDAYRKVAEKGEEARQDFAEAVRQRADEIVDKYIVPKEGTLDLALMFVPSEGAYYEVLTTTDENGRLDDYCRQKHVLPVSPNSLHGYLSAILVGLKGSEAEENAHRMLDRLDEVRKNFEEFAETYTKLGLQIQKIRVVYEATAGRLDHALAALAETTNPHLVESAATAEPEGEEPAAVAPAAIASNNGA